ncbi:MAG: multicomponent K+:H+ antiporter subunit E, partial [Reinekea sp.]
MRKFYHWLLPHPALTILLAVVWTLLQNDVSAGMVVFGIILGIIIPVMTARWWPDRPNGLRVGKMMTYVALVMWDIVVANVEVAWIVLTKRNADMRPNWVVIPLDLYSPEA